MCVALSRAHGGWAVKTIQQGECPNITASNLVSSKSVRRLLALLVDRDFLMDADRNRMWAHPGHTVVSAREFSRGHPWHTLGHGGNGCNQGFAFEEDMCDMVETHTTFLCILLACFKGLTHCASSALSVLVHLWRES